VPIGFLREQGLQIDVVENTAQESLSVKEGAR
jgi:D-methionine transport system ATP-binding protein